MVGTSLPGNGVSHDRNTTESELLLAGMQEFTDDNANAVVSAKRSAQRGMINDAITRLVQDHYDQWCKAGDLARIQEAVSTYGGICLRPEQAKTLIQICVRRSESPNPGFLGAVRELCPGFTDDDIVEIMCKADLSIYGIRRLIEHWPDEGTILWKVCDRYFHEAFIPPGWGYLREIHKLPEHPVALKARERFPLTLSSLKIWESGTVDSSSLWDVAKCLEEPTSTVEETDIGRIYEFFREHADMMYVSQIMECLEKRGCRKPSQSERAVAWQSSTIERFPVLLRVFGAPDDVPALIRTLWTSAQSISKKVQFLRSFPAGWSLPEDLQLQSVQIGLQHVYHNDLDAFKELLTKLYPEASPAVRRAIREKVTAMCRQDVRGQTAPDLPPLGSWLGAKLHRDPAEDIDCWQAERWGISLEEGRRATAQFFVENFAQKANYQEWDNAAVERMKHLPLFQNEFLPVRDVLRHTIVQLAAEMKKKMNENAEMSEELTRHLSAQFLLLKNLSHFVARPALSRGLWSALREGCRKLRLGENLTREKYFLQKTARESPLSLKYWLLQVGDPQTYDNRDLLDWMLLTIDAGSSPLAVADQHGWKLRSSFSIEKQQQLLAAVRMYPTVAAELPRYESWCAESPSRPKAIAAHKTQERERRQILSACREQARRGDIGFLSQAGNREILSAPELSAILDDVPWEQYVMLLGDIESVTTAEERSHWHASWRKLLGLQERAAKTEYCPWQKELFPLLKHVSKKGILSTRSEEDGERMVAFVRMFGMVNCPRLLECFLALERAPTVDAIPGNVRNELAALGIRLANCRTPREALARFREVMDGMITNLLNDETPGILTSSKLAGDLLKVHIGETQWDRGDSLGSLITALDAAKRAKPEEFTLTPGFAPITVHVPLKTQEEKRTPEADELERKILGNEEVQQILSRVSFAATLSGNPWPVAFRSCVTNVIESMDAEVSTLTERLPKVTGKGREHMERKINEASTAKECLLNKVYVPLEKWEEIGQPDDAVMADMIDLFIATCPAWCVLRDDAVRAMSLSHARLTLTEQQNESLKKLPELPDADRVFRWADFVSGTLHQHYLHPDQDPAHTGHRPFADATLKTLAKVWQTAKLDKNAAVVAAGKMRSLREGGSVNSDRTVPVTLVPVKGLLKVLAGDIGDACYTSQHALLAAGDYPNITAWIMVTDRGTSRQRLAGSVLSIGTEDLDGRPTFLIRANNPKVQLLARTDADACTRQILAGLTQRAVESGYLRSVVSFSVSNASSTNRPPVAEYYHKHFRRARKVALVKTLETQFNHYNCANPHGKNGVREITPCFIKADAMPAQPTIPERWKTKKPPKRHRYGGDDYGNDF